MDSFILGWQAASHGEGRAWCVEVGPLTLEGWEAYWEEYSPK